MRSPCLFEDAAETADVAASYRALGDLLMDQGRFEAGSEAYRTGIVAIEERL